MYINLLQINTERAPELAFESYCRALGLGGVKRENYDLVFEGEVDAEDPEGVFRIFNLCPPEGYGGRSMSVSDVVLIDDGEAWQAWYCDNIGFVKLEEW